LGFWPVKISYVSLVAAVPKVNDQLIGDHMLEEKNKIMNMKRVLVN
jgi:hypothetical protein